MNYPEAEDLLAYHYWARDRMLDAIEALTEEEYTRDLGSSHKSIRNTVVHIYAAELVWYSRWKGHSPAALLAPDKFQDVPVLRSAWRDLELDVHGFLRDLGPDGAARVFEYKTLSGQPSSSLLWQMVQDVVNHASYHRGQVTAMLRQIGAAPPQSNDLIAFYRLREKELSRQ